MTILTMLYFIKRVLGTQKCLKKEIRPNTYFERESPVTPSFTQFSTGWSLGISLRAGSASTFHGFGQLFKGEGSKVSLIKLSAAGA